MCNKVVDALENVVARLSLLRDGFCVEIIYKPPVHDHIINLPILNDDQHILHFMENANVLKNASIDEDEHKKALQDEARTSKGKIMPSGVVSFEKLYDL